MAFAVIQTVDPYHPQGRTDLPTTDKFIRWIFPDEEAATKHKDDLALAGVSPLAVVEVDVPPWVYGGGRPKAEEKPQEEKPQEEKPQEEP